MKTPPLRLTVFLSLACLTIACTGSRPAPKRPRRAVIIVLDMFRADYPRRLRLPALEALYRRATVFENAHVGHLPATTVVALRRSCSASRWSSRAPGSRSAA